MVCETKLRECEVVFKIPVTPENFKTIYKAIEALEELGISFDTGYGCGIYDWELDWSLKGAKVYFKRFKDE